jgi:DeoR/GlpR family transcriptional regulator of sugar metabolism
MISGMINTARRTIVLADASKLGHSSFAQIAPLERIDTLVTDEKPASDLMQALQEAGVELIIASAE